VNYFFCRVWQSDGFDKLDQCLPDLTTPAAIPAKPHKRNPKPKIEGSFVNNRIFLTVTSKIEMHIRIQAQDERVRRTQTRGGLAPTEFGKDEPFLKNSHPDDGSPLLELHSLHYESSTGKSRKFHLRKT
jgi:hypothetical protein